MKKELKEILDFDTRVRDDPEGDARAEKSSAYYAVDNRGCNKSGVFETKGGRRFDPLRGANQA